jgi:hypothetical protein
LIQFELLVAMGKKAFTLSLEVVLEEVDEMQD